MTFAVNPSRTRLQAVLWALLALGAGIAVAVLPLPAVVVLFAGAVLVLALLVEPVLGIVLMLSIAPLKTLIATEFPLAAPFDPGLIGLVLALGSWFVWRMSTDPHTPLPRSRVYWPVIAILGAFALSIVNAASLGAWAAEIMKWAAILVVLALVLDLGVSQEAARERWPWIAFGVILAGTLQALIGLYEFFGGSGAPYLWIADFRFFRAFGTFGQPNPFSAFMGLTAPLALGLTWGYARAAWAARRSTGESASDGQTAALIASVYGVCSALLLAGLVASWGRGAWLGFGAASAVMVFFAPPRRWYAAALLGLGLTGMIVAWTAGFVPASITARIDNALTEFTGFGDMRGVVVNDANYAIVERLAHWQVAVNMANAHPVFGVGAGHYELAYAEYGLPSWPRALGHAHNDYLNVLAETGLVGLSVYVTGWLLLIIWTAAALRQSGDMVLHGLTLGLLGTWTHLTVHSMVDKLYVNNLFLHIGAMLGLLAVAYRVSGIEQK